MSYWLEFAIADPRSAESVFLGEEDDVPRLTVNGVTEPELAELAGIFGLPYEPSLAFSDEHGEVMISELSPAFVDALVNVKTSQLDDLAVKWHETFASYNPKAGTSRDTKDRLESLCNFAVEARRKRTPILYTQVL